MDVVDDEYLDWAFGGFEVKAELLLQCGEEGGKWDLLERSCGSGVWGRIDATSNVEGMVACVVCAGALVATSSASVSEGLGRRIIRII